MRRSFFAVVVCLVAASSLFAQAVDRSLVLEEFEIPTDGDQLLIPVTVGDKPCAFWVDTGAFCTVFDRSLKPHLGPLLESRNVPTPNGRIDLELYAPPVIQLGRMPVTMKGRVGCIALDEARMVGGEKIDGVLGSDVLSQHVVRLDFERGTLSFLKEPGPPVGIRVNIGNPRFPTIEYEVAGGYTARFLIDTGAITVDSGSIHSKAVSSLERMGCFTEIGGAYFSDASGSVWRRHGIISKCSIAGIEFTNTIWHEHQGGVPNFVSLRFLTQFNITIDFPNSVMYLAKNKNFGRRDLVDLSGLHFRRIDGRTVIESVDDNSPADKLGIRGGDVINAIGTDEASTTRLFVLRKALCQPGSRIPLVLKRGTATFERELVLPGTAVAREPEAAGAVR